MGVGTQAELKVVLAAKNKELNDYLDRLEMKVDGDHVQLPDGAFEQAELYKKDIDQLLALMEMKGYLDSPEENGHGLGAQASQSNGREMKSLGQAFVESKEFTDFRSMGVWTMPKPFEVDAQNVTAGVQYKDVYTSMNPITVVAGVGQPIQWDPMVPRPHRTNRIRDLFPVAQTQAALIEYFRVTGFLESLPGEDAGSGAAGMVPERSGSNFGLKPHSNLQFESASAQVRTIAHWEVAHRNIIADAPQLQSTIDNELRYGLSLMEDSQILNGDGLGENLLGILNTPNVQSYTAAGAETRSDSVRRAMTKAALAYYPATGVVLHPNDWEQIEIQKDTTERYMITTSVSVGADTRLWRIPVVESPVMEEGTFLVGGFGLGAQLYDRQSVNVRIAEQHADLFARNAVLILCEERLALATKRPEAFVVGTFV